MVGSLIPRVDGQLRGIGEDVEDGWLVNDRQEGHTGHNLLGDGPNFCLNLFFGLVRNRVPGNGSYNERLEQRYNVLT